MPFPYSLAKRVLTSSENLHMSVDGFFTVKMTYTLYDIQKRGIGSTPHYFVVVIGADDYIFTSPSTTVIQEAVDVYNSIDHGFHVNQLLGWVV